MPPPPVIVRVAGTRRRCRPPPRRRRRRRRGGCHLLQRRRWRSLRPASGCRLPPRGGWPLGPAVPDTLTAPVLSSYRDDRNGPSGRHDRSEETHKHYGGVLPLRLSRLCVTSLIMSRRALATVTGTGRCRGDEPRRVRTHRRLNDFIAGTGNVCCDGAVITFVGVTMSSKAAAASVQHGWRRPPT